MSKCGCKNTKQFNSVLEELTNKMLDDPKAFEDLDVPSSDNIDIDDIESEHIDINSAIADLQSSQSTLILISSALIVALYAKGTIDSDAMRQLLIDTERVQKGGTGLGFEGNMSYLKALLTGKIVPSTHEIGGDDDNKAITMPPTPEKKDS
jgi:hypothetical protein